MAPDSTVMVTAPSGDVRVPDLPGSNRTFAVPAARGMTVLVGVDKRAAGVGLGARGASGDTGKGAGGSSPGSTNIETKTPTITTRTRATLIAGSLR